MKPALLFYCQHSVGLGHLMRSYALCERLAERYRVVLCRRRAARGHRPAARTSSSSRCRRSASSPAPASAAATRATRPSARGTVRAERILAALRARKPQVVLVELFPFGRAKFARELVPLLAARARRAPSRPAACATSSSARADQRAHDDRAARAGRRAPRRRARALRPALRAPGGDVQAEHAAARARPLHGLRRPAATATAPAQRGEHIVVSAGGGRVGAPLLRRGDGRQQRPPDARDRRPADARRGLRRGCSSSRPHNVELVRSVPDLAHELRHAAASISQCGYNTALDLLRTPVPALVVPYATPEEDEQTRRARRLEQLGAVQMATHLNGNLDALLDFKPAPAALDLDGAATTRELLRAGRMSAGAEVLRPYVLRQWRALPARGARHRRRRRRRAGQAVAAGADRRPRARRPRGAVHARRRRRCCDRRADPRASPSPSPPRTYFSDLWMQSAGERITHELRVAIYDHLQRLSLAFHQRTPKGDLLTRVTEDVNDMGELFSDTLGEMLQSALLALGMTVVLLFIDPVLALLSLTTAPLLVVISFVFRRKVRERARTQRRHEGDLASVANEALSAMAVVKAFGAEERGVRARAQPQRAADGRRRRGRAPAGPLRRHRRRAARLRHRARHRLRRLPRGQGRAERRRPDRLRLLHAQGLEPDAQLRPRGEQADRGAGARRPDRRDPHRPTT